MARSIRRNTPLLITARYKSANANSDGLVDGAELGSLAGQLLVIMVVP